MTARLQARYTVKHGISDISRLKPDRPVSLAAVERISIVAAQIDGVAKVPG